MILIINFISSGLQKVRDYSSLLKDLYFIRKKKTFFQNGNGMDNSHRQKVCFTFFLIKLYFLSNILNLRVLHSLSSSYIILWVCLGQQSITNRVCSFNDKKKLILCIFNVTENKVKT